MTDGIVTVMVTYNSAATVANALSSIDRELVPHIVVVDNASADDTVDTIVALGLPALEVIRSDVNLGFGAGCNLGVAAAPTSRRILFLNPDAVLDEGALRTLSLHLDRSPSCGLVAPRLRDATGPTTSAGRTPTVASELRSSWPRSFHRYLPHRNHDPAFAETGPVGTVEGACMLVDRPLFETIGGFDESFFLFFEELDLARRIQAAGRTVDLCSDAWALHLIGTSRASTANASSDIYVRSTVTYLQKWHGRAAATLFRATSWVSWTLRARTGRIDRSDADAWRQALRRAP